MNYLDNYKLNEEISEFKLLKKKITFIYNQEEENGVKQQKYLNLIMVLIFTL